jgi:hypothetical protein
MYQYQFQNGLFRIDHDYFFSRYMCYTFVNFEIDSDTISTSISVGIMGIHFTLVLS